MILRGPKAFAFLLTTFLLAGGALDFQGCTPAPPPIRPGGLQVGDKAYDFSLMDSTGHPVKMADMQPGWYLVLILYRGSWCGACQAQLAELKQDYSKFTALHATLAAVSTDPIEDSADFNQQWRFPFPLLSDPNLQVIDAYGARHPQGHEGKDIAHPSTIIIDPNKVVRYRYVGKTPVDRPTDDEILFNLQQIEKQDSVKH